MTELVMHGIAYPVTSLGPGRRVVLWTAGCSRRCPGCITPELLTSDGSRRVPVELVAEKILAISMPLEGITFSGGDPADQPMALAALLRTLRIARPMWNVLLYTGYTLEQLRADGTARADLLDLADVIIDGPYMRNIAPAHPLAGSGNQRLHARTPEGIAMLGRMSNSGPAFNLGLNRNGDGMLIGVSDSMTRRKVHDVLTLHRSTASGQPASSNH